MKVVKTALALAVVLSARGAIAQPAQDPVEDALRRGVELRRGGRDDEAVAAFAQAFALRPEPRTAAQWGLACQAVGRWAQAESLLRQALGSSADPWVTRNRAALTGALDVASRHLATVEILGGVAGAAVRLNGEDAGVLPLSLPLRVVSGTAVVELTAPGFEPLTLRFVTAPGEVLRERVQMVPRPQPSREPPTPPAAPVAPAAPTTPPDAPAPPHGGYRSPTRVWGGIAIASAGIFAACGAIALVLREDAVSRYNARCEAGDARGECGDLRDRSAGATAAAWVGFPAAVLFAGVGAALWLVDRTPRGGAAARCAPGIVGLSCELRF